jgi:serine/threonine protein kinase/Tol biopolymer transport system component
MTPDRWKQVEQLYHSALKQEGKQRAAFLKEACAGDDELRREVESLLAYEQQAESFIEASAPEAAAKGLAGHRRHSLVGQQLGLYKVLSLLGAGGMGEVYLAQDTRLERTVAVKVLPKGVMDNPDRLKRFEQEAKAASRLNHPNIITIHGIDRAHGLDFIAMEYVAGKTLDKLIPRKGMPLKQALPIAVQMADALAAAHRAGLVHRDLKPANVMVSENGQVKVLDFGLAKLAERSTPSEVDSAETLQTGTRSLTEEGTILGTVAYMSPEQAEGKNLDARSDIFSFGSVLYEMVTGRRAFQGDSTMATLTAILREEPQPASQMAQGLPQEAERIISRCLRKDRERRWQSMADLKVALQELKEESDSGKLAAARAKRDPGSGRAAATVSAPAALPRSHLRRWRWAGAVGITALVLAGVLTFWLRSPLPPPRVLGTVKITSDGLPKRQPLLTDGARLYFMEDVGNRWVLAQVSASGGETMQVPAHFEGLRLIDISPNGSELLVLSGVGREGGQPLWAIPLLGGSPRRLGDIVAGDAAWSPDGRQLVYELGGQLYLCKSDGTDTRKLLSVKGVPNWLRWSPDGRRLRFGVYDDKTGSSSLWEVAADGSNLHPLLLGWNNPPLDYYGSWTPDGQYYVFESWHNLGGDNWARDIWALREKRGLFDKPPSRPVQLTAGPLNYASALASKDGRRLFVLGYQSRGELVRWNAKTGQWAPYLAGMSAEMLDFSRDGQWVTYVTYPEAELWRSKVDGTEKLRLSTPTLIYPDFPRWSPDGKQIAFWAWVVGKPSKIYLVSVEGGNPRQLLPGEHNEGAFSWSPDGNVLVFEKLPSSEAGAANSEIHLVDVRTLQVSRLPGSEGLKSPSWSPDGHYISAVRGDNQRLLVCDIATRKWRELTEIKVGRPSWSRDGRYLYFDSYGNDPAVFRVHIGDRKLERLVSLKGVRRARRGGNLPWIGVAPDDSPLLLRDIGTQEIYALDWEAP